MTPATLTAAAAILLAACGDGDPVEGDATPAPTATSAPAATEREDPAPAERAEEKPRTYRVKEGDSLSVIAQRFDTTVEALVRLNDIDDPHHIVIGQELQLPPER